jgi:hypothetical protein
MAEQSIYFDDDYNTIWEEEKIRRRIYSSIENIRSRPDYQDTLYQLVEYVPKEEIDTSKIERLIFPNPNARYWIANNHLDLRYALNPILNDRCCIAGSSALRSITGTMYNDIDIFLIGDYDPVETIKLIIKYHSEGGYVRNKGTITFAFKTLDGESFIKGTKETTFKAQIILRRYVSVSEVITGFDIDASCCAIHRNKIYLTRRGQRAVKFMVNTVNVELASQTYEQRLCKYTERGFGVQLPKIISNDILIKIRSWKIRNRRVLNTHNLGYLLRGTLGHNQSDYDFVTSSSYSRSIMSTYNSIERDRYSIIKDDKYWFVYYDENIDPSFVEPEDEEYSLKLLEINPGQQNYSWSIHPIDISWEKWCSLTIFKIPNEAERLLGIVRKEIVNNLEREVAVYHNLDRTVYQDIEHKEETDEIIRKYGHKCELLSSCYITDNDIPGFFAYHDGNIHEPSFDDFRNPDYAKRKEILLIHNPDYVFPEENGDSDLDQYSDDIYFDTGNENEGSPHESDEDEEDDDYETIELLVGMFKENPKSTEIHERIRKCIERDEMSAIHNIFCEPCPELILLVLDCATTHTARIGDISCISLLDVLIGISHHNMIKNIFSDISQGIEYINDVIDTRYIKFVKRHKVAIKDQVTNYILRRYLILDREVFGSLLIKKGFTEQIIEGIIQRDESKNENKLVESCFSTICNLPSTLVDEFFVYIENKRANIMLDAMGCKNKSWYYRVANHHQMDISPIIYILNIVRCMDPKLSILGMEKELDINDPLFDDIYVESLRVKAPVLKKNRTKEYIMKSYLIRKFGIDIHQYTLYEIMSRAFRANNIILP